VRSVLGPLYSLLIKLDREGYEGDQDEDPRNIAPKARVRPIKSPEANLLHVRVPSSPEEELIDRAYIRQ
jgi:hypothetical protein